MFLWHFSAPTLSPASTGHTTQLLDATAVGQVTPGPGIHHRKPLSVYLGGPLGALSATAGIFLPAFVVLYGSAGPLLPGIRKLLCRGLSGRSQCPSLALMAVVTRELGQAAIRDGITIALP